MADGFSEPPRICEGGHGIFMPIGGDAEQELNKTLRVLIYGLALLYCFMGVSIVADMFMNAIEAITSRKQRVYMKELGRHMTVQVWNDTVANLTLMALGSSAPEILLAIIEIVRRGCYSGELGPSTIIGSAAFNLLVIVATCMVSLPGEETRLIKEVSVFFVTALFSVLAYVWLLVIVTVTSPDVIEIWEGAATLGLLPVLVAISYVSDLGLFSGKHESESCDSETNGGEYQDGNAELNRPISTTGLISPPGPIDVLSNAELNRPISPNGVVSNAELNRPISPNGLIAPTGASTIASKPVSPMSPMSGTSAGNGATLMGDQRELFSPVPCAKGADICAGPVHDLTALYPEHVHPEGPCHQDLRSTSTDSLQDLSEQETVIGTEIPEICKVQSICMRVQRRATETGTQRHSLKSGRSSLPEKPTVSFCSTRPSCHRISGNFLDSRRSSRSSLITSKRSLTSRRSSRRSIKSLPAPMTPFREGELVLDSCGKPIINEHGIVTFSADTLDVNGGLEDRTFAVPVYRRNGNHGFISCQYHTEALSAVPGYDYREREGTVTFDDGADSAEVSLTVLPKRLGERSDQFQLILDGLEGGACFNPNDDGGAESSVLTVTIHNENEAIAKGITDRAINLFEGFVNLDEARLGSVTWAEQIKEAVSTCVPQEECAALEQMVLWLLAPWRILYSLFVPPTVYCGGWVCFVLSLVHIGVLTACVGDLAELFGCVAGIKDSVTAITFVALGTSMPDLFASRTAAMQDEYADASIVNVTGSNSVNVFLGLGLPWTMGAVFWKVNGATDQWRRRYPDLVPMYPHGAFAVRSDELAFSVVVFGITAIAALSVIWCRRVFLGAELGGPFLTKWASAFLMFMFWSFYLGCCIWRSMVKNPTMAQEVLSILGGLLTVGTGVTVFTLILTKISRYKDVSDGEEDAKWEATACDVPETSQDKQCCPKAPAVVQAPPISPPRAPPPHIVFHAEDTGKDWILPTSPEPHTDDWVLASHELE